MIEVDVDQIKNKIDELKGLIDEYERIKLNIFNQLKNSCVSWQDGNSVIFDSEVYKDRIEADNILRSLKDQKGIFDIIYDKYNSIGKKIKTNLNSRDSLVNTVDSIISNIDGALNYFDTVDTSFYYNEKSTILSQKNKLKKTRDTLKSFRDSIDSVYKKIEGIEKEVKAKINELEQIEIKEFMALGGINE